jgi:RNA polymerase sigma factor for flagellar operon FliA
VARKLLCCERMTAANETRAARPGARRGRASLERRNEYATRYYPLVEKVARTLARRLPASADLAELISAGALGLVEAAARFDRARGESFEAFAVPRIRGAMLDDIRLRDTLSRDMRRTVRAISRSAGILTQRLGRAPLEQELAEHVGISVDELRDRRARQQGARVLGLDEVAPDLLERVADERAADPQELAARRELLAQLAADIATLPPRMQQVLALYYKESLSLREIGLVLGVTECRVCQIHGEATRRLREARRGPGAAGHRREAA